MLAITVDIEDWYHAPWITGSPSSRYGDSESFFRNWNSRYDYLSEPTMRVLNLFGELNIQATFFVVADVVAHYPGLVEEIATRGHEIACHGLQHACKIDPKTKEPLMSQFQFQERTRLAKQILEDASQQMVVGYRAPNVYVAGWMLDSLEQIGFEYDSSVCVNSFYNKTDSSLDNVDTRPYYPQRGSLDRGDIQRQIMEIPLSHYRALGLTFPAQGGPLLRFLGSSYISLGLKQSLRRGDAVIYFHPVDISQEKFPLSSSVQQSLYWAIKGERVRDGIKRLLSNLDAPIGTCRTLVQNQRGA